MMKRKLTGILTLVLALSVVIFGTACSKGSAGKTPTEVFKAYYDAAVKKDFATAKTYLSKGSIDLMEMGAKQQGKTFEQAMKDSPAAEGPMPQLGNEKITGDTATVDLTAEGQKASMPFVKENGEWKIALDKFAISALGGDAPSTSGTTAAPSTPSTTSTPSAEKDEDEDHSDNANH
jgi:Domain of unknown function (DUF4878)